MADMEFTADISDLHTLVRMLDGEIPKSAKASASVFESSFRSVEREIKRTSKASQEYYNEILGVDRAVKSAKQSASAFAPIIKSIEQDMKMSAQSAEEYNRSLLGMDRASKSARESAKAMEAALRAQEVATQQGADTLERLKLKYHETYAASQLYKKTISELIQAKKQGIITTEQYSQKVQKLKSDFREMQAGTMSYGNTFANANDRVTKSMSRTGVMVQQTGYQVGDFLVQVQSGTNWMVAFGQQATQVAGTLTMFGGRMVAIGTVLGIAIPLVTALGAAWMRTRKSNEEASEAVKDFESNLKSVNSSVRDWLRTKEAAAYGITVEELFGLRGIEQAEENLDSAKQAVQELQDALSKGGAESGFAGGWLKIDEVIKSAFDADTVSKFEEAVKNLEDAEKLLSNLRQKQAEQRQREFNASSADALREIELLQAKAKFGEDSVAYIRFEAEQRKVVVAEQIRQSNLTEDQQDALIKVNNELIDFKAHVESGSAGLSKAAQEARNLASAVLQAANNAMQFQQAMASLSVPFKDAMSELDFELSTAGMNAADKLVATRVKRLEETMRAASESTFGFDYGLTDEQKQQLEEYGNAIRKAASVLAPEKSSSGSSSKKAGGIGGTSGIGSDAFSFIKDVLGMDDIDAQMAEIDIWLEQTMLKYESFNAQELEMLRRHGVDKLAIEEEYQRRLAEIDQQSQSQRLNDMSGFFGSLATVAEQGGSKMVKAASVFSAAQALINSYTAYTEMLKDPSFIGRPFARFAAAAAVLASGLKMVNAIKGVGGGGSSGGSSGGGGGPRGAISTGPSQQAAAPQRVLISGLKPGMRLTPEELQDMFDQLYDENQKRGVIFSIEGV